MAGELKIMSDIEHDFHLQIHHRCDSGYNLIRNSNERTIF